MQVEDRRRYVEPVYSLHYRRLGGYSIAITSILVCLILAWGCGLWSRVKRRNPQRISNLLVDTGLIRLQAVALLLDPLPSLCRYLQVLSFGMGYLFFCACTCVLERVVLFIFPFLYESRLSFSIPLDLYMFLAHSLSALSSD